MQDEIRERDVVVGVLVVSLLHCGQQRSQHEPPVDSLECSNNSLVHRLQLRRSVGRNKAQLDVVQVHVGGVDEALSRNNRILRTFLRISEFKSRSQSNNAADVIRARVL
ncbi:hypothetical protein DPMN_158187 [Dreissena polymorpha]|uniref:Uncharacterized protein n=1 Tax=Dreissena polymorpha TaxID=45954 RepID=A0A9D4EJE5_DREPO|nr:hypothetical protein DPMN_158187 [Dreissena polymorpha]